MNTLSHISNRDQSRKRIHFLMLFLLSFSLMIFTGCGSDSSDTGVGPGNGNGNGEEQGPDEVWMVGTSFSPGNLEVTVGTTVTWTNKSGLTHTVTSGTPGDQDGLFDSGSMSEGQTFSYTFEEVGEFDYFCIPHQPNMAGVITVVEE